MIVKYLNSGLKTILLLILVTAPTQYSFDIAKSHLCIADPLIWLGGLMFCFSAAARILFSKASGTTFNGRMLATLKEIMPLPENILFVVLIALSFFKAGNHSDAAIKLFQGIEYVIVAFVLFSKVRYDDKTLAKFGILFLSLVSIVVSIAAIQYFNRHAGIMDVKGTFGNRNTYGGFLAVTLPLILSLILLIKNWWIRIWGFIIISAAGFTLLSGGAALGLLLGCGMVCAFVSRRAFLIWASIIAVAGYFVLPSLPRDNVEVLKQSIRLFDEDGKPEPRYAEWQASVQMWSEQPLLGVGLGNYQSQIGMNYGFIAVKEGPKEQDHNNLFLVYASSTGFLGLIGLLTMLLFWFQRTASSFFSCRNPPGSYQQILALGAMGAIVAFCATSIWTALLVRGVFLLFVIIVAVAISYGRRPAESKI